jgi:hypothetical protein
VSVAMSTFRRMKHCTTSKEAQPWYYLTWDCFQ